MIELTYEQFKACTNSHTVFADRYWPLAQKWMPEYGILENTQRVAAFLATVGVESDDLEATAEGLYYTDPLRLATIFKRTFDVDHDKKIDPEEVEAAKACCRNPDLLAKELYKGYPGAGLIQLTWETNYRKYFEATGVDVISSPSLLRQPEDAFRSACWFWESNGCNEAADAGDMNEVTLKVNGPARLKLAERTQRYNSNLETLNV